MLATKNLTKKFGRRVVVDKINLEIKKGEIVGLLGPNGAGKTTTFNMIVGLLSPNNGDIILGDRTNFSLLHVKNQKAYTLSGGERRRVEIARALISNPKFLLLDEPFTGIDPISRVELQELILHLKEKGIGILISDHNVRETLEITDHAYLIYDAKILLAGDAQTLINNPKARKLYLGEKFKI